MSHNSLPSFTLKSSLFCLNVNLITPVIPESRILPEGCTSIMVRIKFSLFQINIKLNKGVTTAIANCLFWVISYTYMIRKFTSRSNSLGQILIGSDPWIKNIFAMGYDALVTAILILPLRIDDRWTATAFSNAFRRYVGRLFSR